MEKIRERLRPSAKLAGPDSTAVNVLSIATVLLTAGAGIFAIVYFAAIDKTEISTLESKFSPGCEGLSRPLVKRPISLFTVNDNGYDVVMNCSWQYEVLMNDACYALQERMLSTIPVAARSLQYQCVEGYQRYAGFATGLTQNVNPPIDYFSSLECVFTTDVSRRRTENPCVNDPSDTVNFTVTDFPTVAGTSDLCTRRSTVSTSRIEFYGCAPTNLTFVTFPGRLVECDSEVAANTPRFICNKTIRPSVFQIISQAASIVGLAFAVLTVVFGALISLCCPVGPNQLADIPLK